MPRLLISKRLAGRWLLFAKICWITAGVVLVANAVDGFRRSKLVAEGKVKHWMGSEKEWSDKSTDSGLTYFRPVGNPVIHIQFDAPASVKGYWGYNGGKVEVVNGMLDIPCNFEIIGTKGIHWPSEIRHRAREFSNDIDASVVVTLNDMSQIKVGDIVQVRASLEIVYPQNNVGSFSNEFKTLHRDFRLHFIDPQEMTDARSLRIEPINFLPAGYSALLLAIPFLLLGAVLFLALAFFTTTEPASARRTPQTPVQQHKTSKLSFVAALVSCCRKVDAVLKTSVGEENDLLYHFAQVTVYFLIPLITVFLVVMFWR